MGLGQAALAMRHENPATPGICRPVRQENSALKSGCNVQRARPVSANTSDLSSTPKVSNCLEERFVGSVDTVMRRQLTQIKARLLVEFAQYGFL